MPTPDVALADAITAEMRAMADGKAGGAAGMDIFSERDNLSTPPTFTRNTQLWCKELVPQLTGIICCKTFYNNWESEGGIPITPRHYLGCQHAHQWSSGTWSANGYGPLNSKVIFADRDGNPVIRTQIGQAEYATNNPDYVDLFVGLLDEPLPPSIHILPIMDTGPDFYAYALAQGVPFIVASQGYGDDSRPTPPADGSPPTPASDYPQHNAQMLYLWHYAGGENADSFPEFKYNLWYGDSGSPKIFVANGVSYLFEIITGSDGLGVEVSRNIAKINHLISVCDADAVARGTLDVLTGLTVRTVPNPFVFQIDHTITAMDIIPITLDPMTEGDSWDGIAQIGPIEFQHWDATADPPAFVTDSPPGNLTRAVLSFALQDTKTNVLVCDSDVTDDTITGQHPIIITNAVTWALNIPAMGRDEFPLTAGTWVADFEFYYGTNGKKTLYRVTQVVNSRI